MLNGKKVVGIITEYNPFHAGHQYMIDQIRAEHHAEVIVAAMSGDFVQRGEPAIFDKYERARDALLHGVDLVVQIPVMFSTSSAEDFAAGGVAVLRSLGFVDELVFGSESADLAKLQQMAALELSTGSTAHAKFNAVVRDGVASGMSYPKARAEAMKLVLSGDDEDAFAMMLDDISASKRWSKVESQAANTTAFMAASTPSAAMPDSEDNAGNVEESKPDESYDLRSNDVLGLEYIKAVKRQGDCFEVACIRRKMSLPSAHSIRDAILQNELSCVAAKEGPVPERVTSQEVEEGGMTTTAELSAAPLHGIRGAAHQGYATLDMLSDMLSYRLLQLSYLDSVAPEASSVLCDYLDVSREIADALRKQVRERMSFRERIAAVKSRNYTYSRISRALLHILLDLQRKEHAALRGAYFGEAETMPYVRVLGVRKQAKELLSAIATTAVTSPARYQRTLDALRRQTIESPEDLLQSIRAGHAELMFRSDLYAADLYRLIYHPYQREAATENEFTRRFLVID